ncbi:unnamed protein product [Soboliphyme baturini]|uniref:Solute carrier family 29 member 3 n=1 Tax=Soboliphyme baturini TaxID=241478 RepID=A0A183ISX6_9BILA|nr:unnamed protein product [Soboliphyme baturini]
MVWVQLFNIFLIFFVTLAIFPGLQANIMATHEDFILTPKYFVPVMTYLIFNVFAFLGNIVPNWIRFPGPRWLCIPVLLRVLFIPLFMFCNYKPMVRTFPVYITSEWLYMFIGSFMAFTGGYYSSLVMMCVPRLVKPPQAPIAAMLATFFLVLGIVVGVNFTLVVSYVTENCGPCTPLILLNATVDAQC